MTSSPEALEALARAYDREDASQRGEPDPWDDGAEDPIWRAERLACAKAAMLAIGGTLIASGGGEALKPEHLERARQIVNGRGFNRPNDRIEGERIVGWAVPEDVAGLSEAIFALDAISATLSTAGAEEPVWRASAKSALDCVVHALMVLPVPIDGQGKRAWASLKEAQETLEALASPPSDTEERAP